MRRETGRMSALPTSMSTAAVAAAEFTWKERTGGEKLRREALNGTRSRISGQTPGNHGTITQQPLEEVEVEVLVWKWVPQCCAQPSTLVSTFEKFVRIDLKGHPAVTQQPNSHPTAIPRTSPTVTLRPCTPSLTFLCILVLSCNFLRVSLLRCTLSVDPAPFCTIQASFHCHAPPRCAPPSHQGMRTTHLSEECGEGECESNEGE